jgi:serine/threonine protein kinase
MTGFLSGLKLGPELGRGAFGVVLRGDDPAHGPVAVKILSRDACLSDDAWPAYKASYLAEAQKLARASHKNVVQVHHVVEASDGNSVLICMAFCPGGSLASLYQKGPMSLLNVRKIGTEVLMGLGTLHARQMIHRDIKPANILLNALGEAQISDFGLVTDDLVFGYASQAGYSDHIAYEVWHGRGTSVKSDVWALGMTLFRLLHGMAWYEASPEPKDVVKLGSFADTLRWLPHVPKQWRRVIRKMLNDDTAIRYQNAAASLAALAGVPVAPDWEIAVSDELVRWSRTKGTRQIVVEWHRRSARKQEWAAVSHPLTEGRKLQLSGSGGIVSGGEALRGLERFFAG